MVLNRFDRRIVPEVAVEFVRRCQGTAGGRLGGGAALSGAWLTHRLSRDLDLFIAEAEEHRLLVNRLEGIAGAMGLGFRKLRDAGSFVRGELIFEGGRIEVDVIHEPSPDLGEPPTVEGVVLCSELDLRASKVTCILSRSEPRDLVDLLFLQRAGFPTVADLEWALQKDAGVDPAVLAWLLNQFPVRPLPQMLEPLSEEELDAWRMELMEQMRRVAVAAQV